jgi:hypothetical protein
VTYYDSLDQFYAEAKNHDNFSLVWIRAQEAWDVVSADKVVIGKVTYNNEDLFWRLKAIEWLGGPGPSAWTALAKDGWTIQFNDIERPEYGSKTGYSTKDKLIEWNPVESDLPGLAHEIRHATDFIQHGLGHIQEHGIITGNGVRYGLYKSVPGNEELYPRPFKGKDWKGLTVEKAWEKWRNGFPYGPFH